MKNFTGNHGFTIIELLVTLSIGALLLTAAVPSFTSYVDEAKVAGAAEKIKVDMEWARTQALRNNKNIIMKFQIDGTNWCYGFDDTDNNCDCTTNNCTVNNNVNTYSNQQFNGTILGIALTGGSQILTMTNRGFSTVKGQITISKDNDTATISVNDLGRGHICSDQLSEFMNCPIVL